MKTPWTEGVACSGRKLDPSLTALAEDLVWLKLTTKGATLDDRLAIRLLLDPLNRTWCTRDGSCGNRLIVIFSCVFGCITLARAARQ